MGFVVNVVQPVEGAAFTYQRIGPSSAGVSQGRISLTYSIGNTGATDLTITSVTLDGQKIDEGLDVY